MWRDIKESLTVEQSQELGAGETPLSPPLDSLESQGGSGSGEWGEGNNNVWNISLDKIVTGFSFIESTFPYGLVIR